MVEKSFHVSMASLDVTGADDQMVQVMLCYEDKNYLLCSLKKGSTCQVPLDLNFQEGTEIAFICNGNGHIHLTGYIIPDEDLDLDELDEEEEDEEEQVPQLVKQSKRKAPDTLKNEKKLKRPKQEVKADSSDDDDDDFELDMAKEEDDSEDEEQDELLKEEEEEDSEEEEEEDEDEEEEEEEEQVQKKPVQHKDKKNKQLQQQQQQQQKKQDKKKLVNGKEAKQEQQQQKQKKNKGEQQQNAQNAQNAQGEQKKRVVEGGVQVEDLKVGTGTPAKAGKFISVYYVGRLKNGKKFDSTTQGDGFKFRLGKGEVIKGWDVGIAGMKIGGKRRITIPPAMAYGAKGSPPVIPGNSTLVFEVELRNVH